MSDPNYSPRTDTFSTQDPEIAAHNERIENIVLLAGTAVIMLGGGTIYGCAAVDTYQTNTNLANHIEQTYTNAQPKQRKEMKKW